MKKILIINGHPVKNSFSFGLENAYKEGARLNPIHISHIRVRELNFNPNLKFGYKKRMEMEPDLVEAIDKIKQADHLVWIFPMWWYGLPALLKGFIDRTFLPDIAFRSGKRKLPEKLFKGKSARIIITSDTPRWYDFLFMKSPAINQLKRGTLKFSGINPVKITYISPIKHTSETRLKNWLNKVKMIGHRENRL